jgi:hypothetical protein
MPRLALILVAMCTALAACQSGVDVDPSATLPGAWQCDDGIVLTIQDSGRYEWRVPAGESAQVGFGTAESEHHRTESDGSYSLLGAWRLDGSKLELDMLGETDRYSVAFSSPTSVSLAGPETYTCTRS